MFLGASPGFIDAEDRNSNSEPIGLHARVAEVGGHEGVYLVPNPPAVSPHAEMILGAKRPSGGRVHDC